VSPQVLYLLQNVAAADVEQSWRYAVELQEDGYLAVTPDDEDYALYAQVSKEVALQLMPELSMAGTLLNYTTSIVARTATTNASSGLNTLTIQGPGSDAVWILDRVGARNLNHANSELSIYLYLSPSYYPVIVNAAPAAAQWVVGAGPIHLSHDLAVVAFFVGCTAGDDLELTISGYEMELAT
jgi:hypothetical protein